MATSGSSTPLTARNLSEQNWQLDHPSSPATDPAPLTPAADDVDPEMKALNTDMEGMAVGPAVGRAESSRSVNGKTVVEKKRKYSADLYQYTKGMWQMIRDDIERRKATGDSPTNSSQSTTTESDFSK